MPTTFAGPYLYEPSDFDRVISEELLIQAADDPKSPTPIRRKSFADLTEDEADEIIPRVNGFILTAAEEIHIRARGAGFFVPLSPLDGWISELAARLVRRIIYDKRNFEMKKEFIDRLNDDLELLASGRGLPYGTNVTVTPVAASVHGLTSQPRVFSRDTLKGY